MPIAIALIVVAVVLVAMALIGLIWAGIVLLGYAYGALAVYLIWRSNRKYVELSQSVQREADRQRLFNEQEIRAWRRSIELAERSASRREKALRRFDSTRDPKD